MSTVTLRDLMTIGLKPRGAYSLSLGTCLGAGVWVTFVGGIIMFKHLPRQQFGNVQKKLFPAYFTLTSSLSALLLGLQLHLHPLPSSVLSNVSSDAVILPVSFSAMLCSSLVNLFVIGPWTSKIMADRHKKEREEGKSYGDADVSEEMKNLNWTFGVAHSISSLLNFGFLLPTAFAAAWVGQHGI